MQINIEKKHLYIFLSVTIVLFSSLVIAQTFTSPAWDTSKQSHDVLYTNIITSKASTPRVVKVEGDLEITSGSGITLGGIKQTSWPTGGTGGTGDADCAILPPNVPTPVTVTGYDVIPTYNPKYRRINTFSSSALQDKCVSKCPSPDVASCTKVQNEIVGNWRSINLPMTIECEWRCENFGLGGEPLATGCSFQSNRNQYTLEYDYSLICK